VTTTATTFWPLKLKVATSGDFQAEWNFVFAPASNADIPSAIAAMRTDLLVSFIFIS
jgi:hypothetical protein